jgi:hypothetical protein
MKPIYYQWIVHVASDGLQRVETGKSEFLSPMRLPFRHSGHRCSRGDNVPQAAAPGQRRRICGVDDIKVGLGELRLHFVQKPPMWRNILLKRGRTATGGGIIRLPLWQNAAMVWQET